MQSLQLLARDLTEQPSLVRKKHSSIVNSFVRLFYLELRCEVALGHTEESQLLTFHAETLKTRSDLSLSDAARLYDEFIKLNKFVEDEEISVKTDFP